MFKTLKFSKISCKKPHCQQSFCLFDHSKIEKKLATKATQTAGLKTTGVPSSAMPTATSTTTAASTVNQSKIVESSKPLHMAQKRKLSTVSINSSSQKPPEIPISLHSKIPRNTRQKALLLMYSQFQRIYVNLAPSIAYTHAVEQELAIYDKSSQITYSGLAMGTISRLKRREVALDENDTGIDGIYKPKVIPKEDPIPNLEEYIMTTEKMITYSYPLVESPGMPVTGEQVCHRCNTKFLPTDLSLDITLKTACTFHWGKKRSAGIGSGRLFSCCQGDKLTQGCCIGPHVFKLPLEEVYKTRKFSRLVGAGIPVVGVDCEMSFTTGGMECVRVTLVDWNGKLVYDHIVVPENPILDFNTRFSGVKDLTGGKSLDLVRQDLDKIVGKNTILIGHGLENDLAALGIVHDRCIDTVELFPHPSGFPYKFGLAVLTREKLKRFIQDAEHDSMEDAKACIDLVKYKISQKL